MYVLIMIELSDQSISLEKCPALVLNADYSPLSYYPLSLWSWQDSIKSVFLDRVSIVSYYDRQIRSPSFSMKLPSVIALKSYIRPQSNPNFTRFNVFLRDKFSCQYCGSKNDLTFDHLLPRSTLSSSSAASDVYKRQKARCFKIQPLNGTYNSCE